MGIDRLGAVDILGVEQPFRAEMGDGRQAGYTGPRQAPRCEPEALPFRLDTLASDQVAPRAPSRDPESGRWASGMHHAVGAAERSSPGEDGEHATVESDLLTLLHSMSHRISRQTGCEGA